MRVFHNMLAFQEERPVVQLSSIKPLDPITRDKDTMATALKSDFQGQLRDRSSSANS